ncbi:MAG: hypothetical protein PHH85_08990 [Candidatus Methanoperedens sp.]|nr:hypothetical protein [Candidatus Methanoperedens sp.]
MSFDLNTYLPYITAASIALNAAYTWAAYRRKEILVLFRKAMAYYKDDNKTVEEFFDVMDALEAVREKK